MHPTQTCSVKQINYNADTANDKNKSNSESKHLIGHRIQDMHQVTIA